MNEHDRVKLKVDLKGIKKGTEGTIIHVYTRNNMFEVEFPNGITLIAEGKYLEQI